MTINDYNLFSNYKIKVFKKFPTACLDELSHFSVFIKGFSDKSIKFYHSDKNILKISAI